MGLKQHLFYLNYMKNLADPIEKKEKQDMFFGKTDLDLFGGTLAWISNPSVYVWSRTGLKRFVVGDKTRLVSFENCNRDGFIAASNPKAELSKRFNTINYNNLNQLKKRIKSGGHLFLVFGDSDHRIISDVMVNPSFDLESFQFCFINTKSDGN